MAIVILPISIIPPVPFFVACANASKVIIDGGEHYQKQTVRNRYHILSANGILPLTVNVKSQKGEKIPTGKIIPDYDKKWVREHLRAIESAYRSAPFFEHYFPEIRKMLETRYSSLEEMFVQTFPKWLEMSKVTCDWSYSPTYVEISCQLDLRKRLKNPDDFPDGLRTQNYMQVFFDRFPFAANLSIIDLLMNEGPVANSFLPKGLE